MKTTKRIAAAVVRCVLALLLLVGGQGGDAWIVLTDLNDDD